MARDHSIHLSDSPRLAALRAETPTEEAFDRLSGGEAHDLNNLLSPILGYLIILNSVKRSLKMIFRYCLLILMLLLVPGQLFAATVFK